MRAFDQLCKSILLLQKAFKEATISAVDMTTAMHRFNQHKYDGWNKRKIRRYKRRERQLKLKMKLEKKI